MPVRGRVQGLADQPGTTAPPARSMDKDESDSCFGGELAACLAAMNVPTTPLAALRTVNAPPDKESAASYGGSQNRTWTQALSNTAPAKFGTIGAQGAIDRDSGFRDVFSTDQLTSKFEQTYGSAEALGPAEQRAVSSANKLGDKSLCSVFPDLVSKAAVTQNSDALPRIQESSQKLESNNQPIEVATGQDYENQQATVCQSADAGSLAVGHTHGDLSSVLRPIELTQSDSEGDGVQASASTTIAESRSSASKPEAQSQTPAAPMLYLGSESRSNYLEDQRNTQSDQTVTGIADNATDQSVKGELLEWPPAKVDNVSTAPAASAALRSLKPEADGPSRRLQNSTFSSILPDEGSRVSSAAANREASHYPGGGVTEDTGMYGLTSRSLPGLDYQIPESAVTLKVKLEVGGSVRANIRERSGTVEVHMMTDDSQAALRLTNEVEGLRSALGNSGLKLQSLEVNYQTDQRQQRSNRQPAADSRNGQHSGNEGEVFTITESNQ
jgi:hypothetical protein